MCVQYAPNAPSSLGGEGGRLALVFAGVESGDLMMMMVWWASRGYQSVCLFAFFSVKKKQP